MIRYLVTDTNGSDFAVLDLVKEKIVYKHASKPTVITMAQKLSGYAPADGEEQTYANQKSWAVRS
jgi:hypothetical protein